MKIAVTAWNFNANGLTSGLAEQAHIAETMGFDAFWLPENHFSGAAAIPSPLLLLASVASRTNRIRLGTTSYLLPIRHPILAAEEVAVLDQLSNGRVILGIGRGFSDAMFSTFNIPTREKRARFRENLRIMMDAWSGQPIDQHEGTDVVLAPLPVQRPHPPLWVAAFGPLAIKQAGTLGLPYIASPVESISSLKENIEAHTQHVEAAGHPQVTTRPVMRTVFATNNATLEKQVRQALENENARQFRDENTPLDAWAIVGTPAMVREKISEYQETLGLNYLIARGRLSGIADKDQIRSHELLLECADG